MKHCKRNGEAFFGLCFMEGMLLAIMVWFIFWGMEFEVLLIVIGGMLAWLLLLVFSIPGLFTDTIYYDENSVKLVTKKITVEYKWKEIKCLRPIIGIGGVGGFDIIPYDGKPISVAPAGSRFYRFLNKYVRKEYPHIEISKTARAKRKNRDEIY